MSSHAGELCAAQQYTRSVRVRLRYRCDNLVARGTAVLISWLALACLAFVVPMSLVLVWADRRVPPTASGRLTAVWVSVGQTLKIGGAVGSPSSFWRPPRSHWSPCCSCRRWSA
ncbi:hypothetical protein ACFWSF_32800 [Streptomyces sp. NPDC058611]|uniref:hypothetical protein n=1 Tax=unclassified Streptomyces TaxID=2593676 RepID=UPI0036567C83